ncbi:MAG: alkaline phosphatase family protein [Bacteroides sp.]|nr:alkaline phosphatase family protein [Bacteroides sp.]
MKGIITSILTVLTFTGLQAQSVPSTPRLIVGLTIDQLRTDYLESFSPLYGEKGFKRLWKEGMVYRNASYNFADVDRASAIASIYTGTSPSMNGIIGNYWLDTSTLRPVNCVQDLSFMGNYTDESSSPSQLLVSTFADELKIATQNNAMVYAVSPFRDAAILSAGHAANGAFWLNENTGKWCSTTYYADFPWWVSQYNDRKGLDFRIENIVWQPLLPSGSYTYLPEWRRDDFRYKFDDDRRNKFRRLITSPFVNDEVNLLVEDLLEHSFIGQDDVPDLLALTYYAGNYDRRSPQEYAMELQDTYARLDRSIEDLLTMLDRKVGLENVLFFVTSTGYSDPESADIILYRIPGGEFHLNRCTALLNIYLMATYGEGQFVEAYYNQNIYLNHKLIEQKGLDLAEIQNKAADFLIQFSGVNEVHSAHRLLLGAWTPESDKIRNAYHRKRSGDLIIDVLPGWRIIDDSHSYNNRVVRKAYSPAPLIFLSPHFRPEIIETPVTMDHIAPTIAQCMRIRAPNASASPPLYRHSLR